MDNISSLQNQRIKNTAKLRERRERLRERRMLIDGVREIRRALRHGVPMIEAFVCEALCRSDESHAALDELAAAGVPLAYATEPVFRKLAFGDRAEGIVAVAQLPERSLAEIALPAAPLVAVLDGLEKPGNIGAVIRSADAAGVSAVMVADGRADLYSPNCIRASLGTLFALSVCAAPASEVREWLTARGLTIFAARVDAALDYTSVDYRGPTAIVLGSEAAGLGEQWTGEGVTPVRLPMRGAADSLNVSATAAVMFYEALRQRAMGG